MIKKTNIYLRPIVSEDLENLNHWKNDEEIFKFLGGGYMPISIDQQKKWLDNLIDLTGENKRYMICKTDTNKAIGMVGLYEINWIHRTAEVGLYIGAKEEHRKGYAKEAYNLLESFVDSYLNMRKLKLNVVEYNSKAKQMWEDLGFYKAGLLRKDRYIDGNYYDVLIMEKFLE